MATSHTLQALLQHNDRGAAPSDTKLCIENLTAYIQSFEPPTNAVHTPPLQQHSNSGVDKSHSFHTAPGCDMYSDTGARGDLHTAATHTAESSRKRRRSNTPPQYREKSTVEWFSMDNKNQFRHISYANHSDQGLRPHYIGTPDGDANIRCIHCNTKFTRTQAYLEHCHQHN
uniref:C2H2-type domain-containing protein n=1 Tax=Lygus hesperus TaxID=30085 RepID=A0A0A9VX66_LYGHE